MAADAGPLHDKVVIVSGATGELGTVVTRMLRERGARTAIAVRRPWQVAKAMALYGPANVLVGCVPSGDGEAAAGFVKGATDALGPIDALLCTNGAFASSTIGKDPGDELAALLQANLFAATALARAVVGPMKRRRTGSLVFVGSAEVGGSGWTGVGGANYLASKAALHEWVRALAVELHGSGVRAAAVLPRTIDTERNRAALPAADRTTWHSIDRVAQFLLDLAFASAEHLGGTAAGGPAPRGGPLYPMPISG